MKTHCSQGHDLGEVGVYGNGRCRECQKQASRENHEEKMAARRAAGLAPGHGRWNKDGRCRSGRHVLAEVGVYTSANGQRCKACARENQLQQRHKYPQVYEKVRNSRLLKLYGLTVEQYATMLAIQEGLCAICRKPETATDARTGQLFGLTVDHDHKTGKVRALLCHRCNRALGIFEDDVHLLRAALDYLNRSAPP